MPPKIKPPTSADFKKGKNTLAKLDKKPGVEICMPVFNRSDEFDAPFIPPTAVVPSPAFVPQTSGPNEAALRDLVRIVELIVAGDIDSAKFKEILTKRQGSIKP